MIFIRALVVTCIACFFSLLLLNAYSKKNLINLKSLSLSFKSFLQLENVFASYNLSVGII